MQSESMPDAPMSTASQTGAVIKKSIDYIVGQGGIVNLFYCFIYIKNIIHFY